MENYQDKNQFYTSSDLKLQAFLRLMLPDSFVGLNKTTQYSNKVNFVFKKSKVLTEFINGYLSRRQYLISPLSFAENIDQGKGMIFGDFSM